MFCHITANWRGRPLVSREVVVNLIGGTTTTQGLHVKAVLDENRYAPGIKVSDEELATLAIERDEFHGEWNRGTGSDGWRIDSYQPGAPRTLTLRRASMPHMPAAGAVCGSSARTDLCGGRRAIFVRTATYKQHKKPVIDRLFGLWRVALRRGCLFGSVHHVFDGGPDLGFARDRATFWGHGAFALDDRGGQCVKACGDALSPGILVADFWCARHA